MVAGKNTFIDDMLSRIGLENASDLEGYPEITGEELRSKRPELIFLSSEPFPFREKHQPEIAELSPGSKIILVDGEMFSWYGSRLVKAPEYLKQVVQRVHGIT